MNQNGNGKPKKGLLHEIREQEKHIIEGTACEELGKNRSWGELIGKLVGTVVGCVMGIILVLIIAAWLLLLLALPVWVLMKLFSLSG